MLSETGWRVVAAVVAVALVIGYAIGSGRWVTTGSTWYLSLQQPPWQPPPAVFGLAWAYNFTALAVAGIAIALRAAPGRVALFLVPLAVSILLAIAWAYLFYASHALVGAAVALSMCALLTVVPVAVAFVDRAWVGWILVPYLIWLLVATSLSWGYVALNRA